MYELKQMFPTPDALLALEPDVLGSKILALLSKSNPPLGMFSLDNFVGELWPFALQPANNPLIPKASGTRLTKLLAKHGDG